ncbi:hypothetical protein KKC82_00995 [bacterium]|nr:hypothetical protein [bacterium]
MTKLAGYFRKKDDRKMNKGEKILESRRSSPQLPQGGWATGQFRLGTATADVKNN